MAKVEKKLQNYLVLNKYLSSLFGFKDIEDFRKLLKSNVSEGISQNKKMYYTEVLQTLNIDEEFRQKLNQYDENIQEYLNHINQKRDPPIVLKYFQYLAVLFTEIYLDKYYNEFEKEKEHNITNDGYILSDWFCNTTQRKREYNMMLGR